MKPVTAALVILLVSFIELHAKPEEREIDVSPFSMNLQESMEKLVDEAVEEAITQQIANIQELNVFEGPVNIYEFTGDEAQPNFFFILSDATDNVGSVPSSTSSFIEYAYHEMPSSGTSFIEHVPQGLDIVSPLTASGKSSKSPSASAKASKSPTTSAKASKSPSAGKSEKSKVPLTNGTSSFTFTMDATVTGSSKSSKSPSASAKASKSPTTSAKASKSPSAGKSGKSIVPLTSVTSPISQTILGAAATGSGKASKSPTASAKASKSPTTSAKASKSPSGVKSGKSTNPLTSVTSPISETTLGATATGSGKASKSPSASAKASKAPSISAKASKSPSVGKSGKSINPLTNVTSPSTQATLDSTAIGSGKASKSPSAIAKASKRPTRAKSSKSASPVQTPVASIQPYAMNSNDVTTYAPSDPETADRNSELSFLSSSTHSTYCSSVERLARNVNINS
ncbi:hypothetical protein ACHAW6_001081 [Cyclotella cf. meneghiniana]